MMVKQGKAMFDMFKGTPIKVAAVEPGKQFVLDVELEKAFTEKDMVKMANVRLNIESELEGTDYEYAIEYKIYDGLVAGEPQAQKQALTYMNAPFKTMAGGKASGHYLFMWYQSDHNQAKNQNSNMPGKVEYKIPASVKIVGTITGPKKGKFIKGEIGVFKTEMGEKQAIGMAKGLGGGLLAIVLGGIVGFIGLIVLIIGLVSGGKKNDD
jgi:hypothetical protein